MKINIKSIDLFSVLYKEIFMQAHIWETCTRNSTLQKQVILITDSDVCQME